MKKISLILALVLVGSLLTLGSNSKAADNPTQPLPANYYDEPPETTLDMPDLPTAQPLALAAPVTEASSLSGTGDGVTDTPAAPKVVYPNCTKDTDWQAKCTVADNTPWSGVIGTFVGKNGDGTYRVAVYQADNPDVIIMPDGVTLTEQP